jgi:SAM-dependent methyltransferase
MGVIELRRCRGCGLVFNAQYDPQAIKYDISYDNSLDFSPAFQSYAKSLAEHLVADHQLYKSRIVEIGCGNGAFLKLLCGIGNNIGKGYDPSHAEDVDPVADVSFVNKYFSPLTEDIPFDFLCCRHVLEHLESPLDFLTDLAGMSAGNSGAVYYFEVPSGEFVLKGEGIWDVIYPHVSYFTAQSLESLFKRAGFEVLRVGKTFSDQFLFIEARKGSPLGSETPQRVSEQATGSPCETELFETQFANAAADWSELIGRLTQARKRVSFWGVGAKGVTFLNLVSGADNIFSVIDSNPRKQHMFVPGTGQVISAPETLHQFEPEAVILLNPAYRGEISPLLSSLEVSANILTQPDLMGPPAS